MRWFKHMTASHVDEKIAGYLSDNGLEGYGFWWILMEVVAAQCVDEKCSATYSLSHWSHMLYYHHHKVSKYLGKLGVTGIVTVEYVESKIKVTIPNLLKYRDEYFKKSGQRRESIPSKKESIDTDKKNKKEPSASSDASHENEVWISKKKRRLDGKRLETFKTFWTAFDYQKGRAEAIDSWLNIPSLTLALVNQIVAAAKAEARARPGLIAERRTPKMAQGWLTARRWEDEPLPSSPENMNIVSPEMSKAIKKARELNERFGEENTTV